MGIGSVNIFLHKNLNSVGLSSEQGCGLAIPDGEREAKIHFELHRHLQNAIASLQPIHGVHFESSEPEYTKNLLGARADIVVFDDKGQAWLVIEAKRKTASGYTRNFDPYSPVVVKQAHMYAERLGTPFFATYNGHILVLYRTFEEFKSLLERKTKAYEIKDLSIFAGELLTDVVNLYHNDAKWDNLDEAFVKRAKNFHEILSKFYLVSLADEIKHKRFRGAFVTWVKEQGFDYDKEEQKKKTVQIMAKQGAYILMNQLLFYKILESEQVYTKSVDKLNPVKEISELSSSLKTHFEKVTNKVNFKAIFERDSIFNSVPITEQMAIGINEFIEELNQYDLTVFKSDVIGRIYEKLIPKEERHDLGQYYTPPLIVELITRMTLTKPDAVVLDPACGSGGFLVKAYLRLQELKSKYKVPSHEEILSQINGVDINRFPAHLSAINLAIQDIAKKTNNVRIEVADFFNIHYGQTRFARKTVTLDDEEREEQTAIPNEIDVIISNPPYIRHEKIANKPLVRKHLDDIKLEMGEKADIYALFFTHAYQFLTETGSIGFITSDLWLDTKYGIQLSNFFLNRFIIKCIVKFDKQVFKDPLIGTVITILRKESSRKKRDGNLVRLLRLKKSMSIEEIVNLLEESKDPETVYESPVYRLVLKTQDELSKEWKWMRYLHAPNVYFDIMKTGKLALMSEVATPTRGRVTGANDFFYMTKEDAKARGLEMKYLKPIMKAIAQAQYINFRKEDTEWYCLDLHDIVNKIVTQIEERQTFRAKDRPLSDLVKKELKKESQGLYDYIEWGEQEEFDKTPTCKARKIWFDVGELLRPRLIFPDVYWKETSVPFNADRVAVDKQLYALVPKAEGEEEEYLLGGIMNSDVNALMREMYGRTYSGEGLNRNAVTVWEAKEMPVIDPRGIHGKQRDRIVGGFKELLTKSREVSGTKNEELRHKLNLAVMATIGLEPRTDELEKEVSKLIDIRISGGRENKEAMVEGGEEEQKVTVTPLRGARIIEKESSLDSFVGSEDE